MSDNPNQSMSVGGTASAMTTPWGDVPGQIHAPVYAPISSLPVAGLRAVEDFTQQLFHPTAPTAMPFNADQLRGQSLIANATGGLRQLFQPITQVFHSPRNDTPSGNP